MKGINFDGKGNTIPKDAGKDITLIKWFRNAAPQWILDLYLSSWWRYQ
jgi:hypothetical protein